MEDPEYVDEGDDGEEEENGVEVSSGVVELQCGCQTSAEPKCYSEWEQH